VISSSTQKVPSKVQKKKSTRYFIVDGDIPVKVEFDLQLKEFYATNSLGNSYPPLKAMAIGAEVDQEEFERLASDLTA
jgi:hypothetical protein